MSDTEKLPEPKAADVSPRPSRWLAWAMGSRTEALVPDYDPPPIKGRTGPKPGY